MKRMKLFSAIAIVSALFLVSCDDDNETGGVYSNGIFISNEGVYGNSNSSVSFYGFSSDSISNDIFGLVNDRTVGDVLQSIYTYGEYTYLVVNNSNKIEVVTTEDFKQGYEIEGVTSPRYMVASSSSKAYVSQWGSDPTVQGSIAIIDLATYSVTRTIATGIGPEGVLLINNKLWVANCGGWTTDSTVTIIDTNADTVLTTIVTGYCPQEFVTDNNGDIWVLCSGDYYGNSSCLVKISASDYTISSKIIISSDTHPTDIEISPDKQTIYYGCGYGFSGVWKLDITATSIEDAAFIDGSFYGMSVNPDNGEIFVFDAGDYVSAGTMTRYQTDGTKIKSYTVGISPNGASF